MNSITSTRFLAALIALTSCFAMAGQNIDRLLIDYPSTFIRDSDSEAVIQSLPDNSRNLIESFKAYKATPVDGLSNINIIIIQTAPSLSVSRNGYVGPITQMKSDPRVSELTHEPVDVEVSGYPAVLVKFKAKFNRELPIAGDILYIYDRSTHTSWTVSVSYAGKNRRFSDFQNLSNKSSRILESVQVK